MIPVFHFEGRYLGLDVRYHGEFQVEPDGGGYIVNLLSITKIERLGADGEVSSVMHDFEEELSKKEREEDKRLILQIALSAERNLTESKEKRIVEQWQESQEPVGSNQ